MCEFIGRRPELNNLENLYSKPNSETCAIYGRRRIGKTSLLNEFCKNKRTIFIASTEGSELMNLEGIRRSISEFTKKDTKSFANFFEALDAIKEACNNKKTVLIIDEYPYLVKSAPHISSILQHFIDHDMKKMDLFLILCGSSIRTMTDEIDGHDKPLFGRFLHRMKIRPLSYKECREFHPGMSEEDNMSLYLIAGGVPLYHKILSDDNFKECIINSFLETYAPLSDEASGIVERELSPSGTYKTIISTIAEGSSRLKEIAEKSSVSEAICSRYLNNMEFLDLVERINPMGNAPKKPLFRIKDNLLRFYYSVINGNASLLHNDNKDAIYDRIKHQIDTYLGHAFEDACSEYVQANYICKDIGKWWGRAEDEDVDIDIVAIITNGHDDYTLFAECKYRTKPIGFESLNTLENRSTYVKGLMNVKLFIFSKSGFTDDLKEYAEKNDVTLISLHDMYS